MIVGRTRRGSGFARHHFCMAFISINKNEFITFDNDVDGGKGGENSGEDTEKGVLFEKVKDETLAEEKVPVRE